jgi:hypothetical protein
MLSTVSCDKDRRYKHPKDTFGAAMVAGAHFDATYDMPLIRQDSFVPQALIPFSIAKRSDWTSFDCVVHFCERDQDIEPFWSSPNRYLPKLMKFKGALGLDYSTCVDFPRALKQWNAYRNRACTYKLQSSGIPTIPLLRGDPDTIDWEVAGLEKGCAIAVSPRGCVRELDNRKRFERGLRNLVERLEPSLIISYGPNCFGVLDYPLSQGITVHQYTSRGRGDLGGGVLSEQIS